MALADRARTYAAVVALAPLLATQGWWVRARTPVLPEAFGPRSGVVGAGTGPPVRIAVIGESTAAGVGVTHQRDGLAAHLATTMAGPATVRWQVVARTGATAAVVRRDLAPALPPELDLVVVVLGVNDTLRLRTPERWRSDMGGLVDAVVPHLRAGGRVVLLGVPDFGAIPALPQPLRGVLRRHGRRLDGELAVLARRREHVVHLAAPSIPLEDAFCFDRFHPNVHTYRAWAHDIASRLPAG